MKKLVIFDFDGTLMDTIEDVAFCFNKALEYYNFKTYPVDYYKKIVGGNLDKVVSCLLDDSERTKKNIDKIKIKYREIYSSDPKSKTKPFENINNLLKKINDNNRILAVNTNKLQALVEDQCERLLGDIKFCKIYGFDENRPSKPDPFAINELIKLNNVTKDETVYIGDTLTDVQTAKNAGVDCVLVSWGQGNVEQISKENKITYIAEKPEDILKFLLIE